MNLHSGDPWSVADVRDLRASLEHGDSIQRAADFLCRSVDETRAKAIDLGLPVREEKPADARR